MNQDESQPTRRFPRLPPETLNAVLRKISSYADADRPTLISAASVSREWRRFGWPHVWKEFLIDGDGDGVDGDVAATARRFSLPWAQKVTRGIRVRDLGIFFADDERIDALASLFAIPFFSGVRILNLHSSGSFTTFQLLVIFSSLPNLVSLMVGYLIDEPVNWGKNLRLAEKEENEIWQTGLGNMKALRIGMMEQSVTGGIMLQKLALGLGERLELMHVGLKDPGTDHWENQRAQLLQNLSDNCPHLVDLLFEGWNANSLQPFLKTQRQIVQLSLIDRNVSESFLSTIAASCTNLRFLEIGADDNIPSAIYKHLSKFPFLHGLSIHGDRLIGETDIVDFLRCRGKDLEYLNFPPGRIGAFPGLVEFLPNIRHFSSWHQYPFEDVITFIHGAPKLESLQIWHPEKMPSDVCGIAEERDVRLHSKRHFEMPNYVASKTEAWMGL
ncbi:hypothetical protein HK104_004966 [Borealophlyctis nickersoniae]|nr:hypothetical protein HK104_004966 [Borealophlyctis nickersoniae]